MIIRKSLLNFLLHIKQILKMCFLGYLIIQVRMITHWIKNTIEFILILFCYDVVVVLEKYKKQNDELLIENTNVK